MIKRLQSKIVWVIMTIVTVLLLLILGLICHNTWMQMEAASVNSLQAAAMEPIQAQKHDWGERTEPCFVLREERSGRLEAYGSEYYDLTDTQMLRQLLEDTRNRSQKSGILWKWNLCFCQYNIGPGESYVFMDVSVQLQTMRTLLLSSALIGLAALAVIFVMTILLARWLVRPVEETWNAQRQFVADASHELKTPLTVIMTNSEMLQSPEYDSQTKARFSASVYAMSCQMRGLVESLLQLARVDDGCTRQQHSRLDMSALVEECVLPFEAVYFEAGRSLLWQIIPGICVMGFAQQLHQVVDILLDNGCKYATVGTQVELRLATQGHGQCVLSVASRGEPLTAQQCRDIFKRFYRVDTARSMNHSYGLGLSIAHAIVEGHRGKIWCQSKAGVNTFFVTLPVHNRPEKG